MLAMEAPFDDKGPTNWLRKFFEIHGGLGRRYDQAQWQAAAKRLHIPHHRTCWLLSEMDGEFGPCEWVCNHMSAYLFLGQFDGHEGDDRRARAHEAIANACTLLRQTPIPWEELFAN